MSNVAAGTFKKETIFAASGLTSGLISHLDLALRRTSTSDWKDFPTTLPSGQGNSMAWRQGFPKRSLQNSETAWPGELKEPIFWPVLGWSSVSNVAAGTAKKETICAAAGLILRTSQNAASKTAKQHGLASWRSPFFDLCWGDLQCQTLRPEPLKKRRFVPLQDLLRRPVLGWSSMSNAAAGTDKKKTIFAASGLAPGLISHLDLALRCTSTSDRQGFPKLRPGELKSPFFDLCCGDLQCQTLRPEPTKKRRFLPLQGLLRALFRTWETFKTRMKDFSKGLTQTFLIFVLEAALHLNQALWVGETCIFDDPLQRTITILVSFSFSVRVWKEDCHS